MIYTFRDETGREVHWKGIEERTGEFLQAFPPEEGYRVVIEQTDLLGAMPGLRSVLEAAVTAGKSPLDAGLGDPTGLCRQVVFTAKLYHDDAVINQASAPVEFNGDPDVWKSAETAARGRLYAAVGIGGDLEADVLTSLMAQKGITDVKAAPSGTSAAPKPTPATTEADPGLITQIRALADELGEAINEDKLSSQAKAKRYFRALCEMQDARNVAEA